MHLNVKAVQGASSLGCGRGSFDPQGVRHGVLCTRTMVARAIIVGCLVAVVAGEGIRATLNFKFVAHVIPVRIVETIAIAIERVAGIGARFVVFCGVWVVIARGGIHAA